MTKKVYELKDNNNNTMQWSQNLVPRVSSGVKNEINVCMHLTIVECNAIFKSIGSTHLNESDFKEALLKHHGYIMPIVENVKSDTTQKNDEISKTILAFLKAGNTELQTIEAFKKTGWTDEKLKPYFKSLQSPQMPQIPKPL